MTAHSNPKLTLGPVYYLWDGPKWRDFYFRIADEAPVDCVTLGETVCSKRSHFIEPHLADVVERLEQAGKRVHLSSLALVTLEREAQQLRRLARDSIHPVEANDLAALGLLNGKPHVIGPLVNTYNAATARLLGSRGARSICLPPELPMNSILEIMVGAPDIAFEIFAFGCMPLAISARCAHARSKGLVKDNCQFVCSDDPDGLPVRTLDRQSFLALNGVQTMSHTAVLLLAELGELIAGGLACIRLSPQDCDMVAVAKVYDDLLHDRVGPEEAKARITAVYPDRPFSNGFYHQREGAAWVARARDAALGEQA